MGRIIAIDLVVVVFSLGLSGCLGGGSKEGAPSKTRVIAPTALKVAPAGQVGRGCPTKDWPGPWTACAEAHWVRHVVEVAGYRVTGETGSALVAQGRGREFYIWTTEIDRPFRQIVSSSPRLLVVTGTSVYGDKLLWRFWAAQGFVFWVQAGPREVSVAPFPSELGSLIRASKSIPPPPRGA